MNMDPGPGSPFPRSRGFSGENDNLSEKSQEIPRASSLYFEEQNDSSRHSNSQASHKDSIDEEEKKQDEYVPPEALQNKMKKKKNKRPKSRFARGGDLGAIEEVAEPASSKYLPQYNSLA